MGTPGNPLEPADLYGVRPPEPVYQTIDKEKAANLTLVDADEIHTPGIREYPLTLECRVLYQQDQDPDRIPEEIRKRFYGNGKDAEDFHTAYVGEIVSAYIIRED